VTGTGELVVGEETVEVDDDGDAVVAGDSDTVELVVDDGEVTVVEGETVVVVDVVVEVVEVVGLHEPSSSCG